MSVSTSAGSEPKRKRRRRDDFSNQWPPLDRGAATILGAKRFGYKARILNKECRGLFHRKARKVNFDVAFYLFATAQPA
jgi:hypothetical protein